MRVYFISKNMHIMAYGNYYAIDDYLVKYSLKDFFNSKYQPFNENCNLVEEPTNFSKIQLKLLLLITKKKDVLLFMEINSFNFI